MIPKTAVIIENGVEKEVSVDQVKKGDIFLLEPDQVIPFDAVILEGTTSVNEVAVTGEPIPVDKSAGQRLISGTYNINGMVKCRAEKVGSETTFAQMEAIVKQSRLSKSPVQHKTKIALFIVCLAAVLFSVLTYFLHKSIYSYSEIFNPYALSVFIVAFPLPLILLITLGINAGKKSALKHGIIFKNSTAFELASIIKTVFLDKTGTVTEAELVVKDIIPAHDVNDEEVVKIAASIEKASVHPLAKAIVEKASQMNLSLYQVSDYKEIPGSGVTANIDGHSYFCGRLDDSSLMGVKRDNILLGAILFTNEIRSESFAAVQELKNMGLDIALITGDNQDNAKEVGRELGIEKVYAQLNASEKGEKVSEVRKNCPVMMVGNGTNDAPALASADVGLAVDAGIELSIKAADIILVKNSLNDVVRALKISRRFNKLFKISLLQICVFDLFFIPAATGFFTSFFGAVLTPLAALIALGVISADILLSILLSSKIK